jgi:hypothetical protein
MERRHDHLSTKKRVTENLAPAKTSITNLFFRQRFGIARKAPQIGCKVSVLAIGCDFCHRFARLAAQLAAQPVLANSQPHYVLWQGEAF